MDISEVAKNKKLMIDDIPFNVEEVEFMKPGKGSAIYRVKMKNLMDGTILERTYHSSDKLKEADISSYDMQYLYKEGENYVFMNTDTFEQHSLSEERMGKKGCFLKEGVVVNMQMLADVPLDITMPNFAELKVVESTAAAAKDTVSAQSKRSTMTISARSSGCCSSLDRRRRLLRAERTTAVPFGNRIWPTARADPRPVRGVRSIHRAQSRGRRGRRSAGGADPPPAAEHSAHDQVQGHLAHCTAQVSGQPLAGGED
jgi:elongation factor P